MLFRSITDSSVTFKVSGAGRLIGVGNGDPTDLASDKGPVRKAFGGMCMALIQSTKAGGGITVEANSPGLASASVTIAAKPVRLRPQVASWARKAPLGAGISGLWRPAENASTQIFALQQDGDRLTGTAEGIAASWAGGGDLAITITEGKINGDAVSFKAANFSYSGKVKGDSIELVRTPNPTQPRATLPGRPLETGPAPVIGPAPDGSDPSRSPSARPLGPVPVELHRVQR